MEQDTQSQEISLVDIIKMFEGKWKMLICITLVAAILGGGFAVFSAVFRADYGTEITFYLSPTDGSNTLLSLIQSESFAEKLLLDENGLPPQEECDPDDYAAALDAVKAAKAARNEKYEAQKALDMLPYSLAIIEENYTNLKENYNEIYNLLNMYKSVNSDIVADSEAHLAKIAEYEEKLIAAADLKNEYEESTYNPAIQEKLAAEDRLAKARELVKQTRKAEDELVEKVLAPWRQQEDIKDSIKEISKYVTFEYDTYEASSKTVENNTFLIVSVSVPKDEERAISLAEKIKSHTPDYVEKNLEKLTGTIEPDCAIISPFSEVSNLSMKSMLKKAVMYAAVAGIAACAVICVVVIGKNMLAASDTSDRDKKEKTEKKATEG